MDRIERNLHRTVVWSFLAAAFRPPSQDPPADPDELRAAASALGLDAGPVLETLAAVPERKPHHDALFGHVVRGRVPAYEGEYGGPRGFRFSHEIGDVRGFYRAFGLRPSRRLPERADHIAVECEFLAFLALKEACAAQDHGEERADLCRDASAKFLSEHLGRFGRSFAARVMKRAGSPFYREAARLLDAAVMRDTEELGVAAGPADLGLREDTGTPDDACIKCAAAMRGVPR